MNFFMKPQFKCPKIKKSDKNFSRTTDFFTMIETKSKLRLDKNDPNKTTE